MIMNSLEKPYWNDTIWLRRITVSYILEILYIYKGIPYSLYRVIEKSIWIVRDIDG
jgi:hypothetical protein